MASAKTSRLLLCPPEVRAIIYQRLFPDLHHYQGLQLGYTNSLLNGKVKYHEDESELKEAPFPSQLKSATNLIATCKSLQVEVAPILYFKHAFIISPYEPKVLVDFTSQLSYAKLLVRKILMAIPYRWNRSFCRGAWTSQKSICDALSQLPALQVVALGKCKKDEDQEVRGTCWRSSHLQALRAIRKACPHLTKATYVENEAEGDVIVMLVRASWTSSGRVEFDVDEEYTKFLHKTRKEA